VPAPPAPDPVAEPPAPDVLPVEELPDPDVLPVRGEFPLTPELT